ncbi:MAG: response regulator [Gemmatimonadetes bacterium]|nr:response regulator [Gemmatimonadota bacterium]
MIGTSFERLVPDDRVEEMRANLARISRGEAFTQFRTVRLKRDGSLVEVELTGSPVRNDAGTILGVSAIVRDVTAQKRLAEQVQHAQRLKSIGRLAGGVAHDFNNLLMAISGYAELVMLDLPEDAPGREDLRALLTAADRGARLTRQLLAFGRRQVLHAVPLDLNTVLREMEGVLRPLTAGDVTLQTRLGTEAMMVQADRAQIEQVLVNLVANARDAMPRGGVVSIETDHITIGETTPRPHPSVQQGDYVRLTVRDTGIGMHPEVQARLFEPFFTTKPRGQSTGMGLATVYGIVKQSGGFITVESEWGRGSVFRVLLPVRATALPGAEAQRSDPGARTVLLVEDDEGVRRMAIVMLERLHFTVIEAPAPSDAIRLLRESAHRVDLVLTDISLPEMTGIQLGEIIASQRPGLPIVYMSGFADAVERHQNLEPGVNFLQKPFSIDALAKALRGAPVR